MFQSASPRGFVLIVLLALVTVASLSAILFRRKRTASTTRDRFADVVRRAAGAADAETFWELEIRHIVQAYGSPVKAAIRIEEAMRASNFQAMDESTLDAYEKYWTEITYWSGRGRIQLYKVDPEGEWSRSAWSRLFNVFGNANLLVKVARSDRTDRRGHSI